MRLETCMKLTIICSWCGLTIGEKDCECLDESLPRITHSICKACCTKVLKSVEESNDNATHNETLNSKGKEIEK